MYYGEKLLIFRAEHNLSQAKLAEILGVNINMISRYERGENEPSAKNKLAQEMKMKEWSERNV